MILALIPNGPEVSCNRFCLFIRELKVWHSGVRIVVFRVAYPAEEPVWFFFHDELVELGSDLCHLEVALDFMAAEATGFCNQSLAVIEPISVLEERFTHVAAIA